MVTDEQRDILLKTACEVREKAYAPYSRYRVGAAILTDDGRVFSGVNVENAAFGLTNCAERSAIYTAISAGARRIVAVAICTENAGSPCGACRQVMSEFADDIPVWLSNDRGRIRQTTLYALLPDHFGPENLHQNSR